MKYQKTVLFHIAEYNRSYNLVRKGGQIIMIYGYIRVSTYKQTV